MIQRIRTFVELQVFGVCTHLGDLWGISTSRIRLYFIYVSFLTLGSPILLYLSLAFLLNLRRYGRQHRNPVWNR
jgi:phage shock protein PspC (stress-responsive transcriptional regulator)